MTSPILIFIAVTLALNFITLFIPFPSGMMLNFVGLHFFNAYTVLAMIGVAFTLSNIARLIVFWQYTRWSLLWSIVPGALVGGLTITYLLTFVPEKLIAFIILSFGIVYIVRNLFMRDNKKPSTFNNVSGWVAGITTGMLSAVGGAGGSLRAAFLTQHTQGLQELTASTAAISLVVGIAGGILRFETWDITWDFFWPLVSIFPVFLLIAYMGKKIMLRLNWQPKTVRLVVNIAVLLSLLATLPVVLT